MEFLVFAISLALIGLGGAVTVLNAWVGLQRLRSKPTRSVVPVVGGVLVAGGLGIWPHASFGVFLGIPLIVDYGCVPYLVRAAVAFVQHARGKSERSRMSSFRYSDSEQTVVLTLFRNGNAVLKRKRGETEVSLSGVWTEEEKGAFRVRWGPVEMTFRAIDGQARVVEESGVDDPALSLLDRSFSRGQ